MRVKVFLTVLALACLFHLSAFAAHPLITDDTGTQGKGKLQLEVNGEFAREDEGGVKEDATELATILSYGVLDSVDLVLGIPYQFIRVKDAGNTTTENGISDVLLELKWKFYGKDGLSLALKPGLSLPTGDDEKGLGAGKAGFSYFFILTKEVEPWAVHLNLGYIRNENTADEREDLWHASLAAQVQATEKLNIVGNIGAERNADRSSDTPPAFILGGVIYSLSENFDVDLGIKAGLNKPETDYSILTGITYIF
ncbi:MAG: transporter [Deltaproteobacteria bacterium]|nr:MAG: transporter [Deltaproteobacteria bacterium]